MLESPYEAREKFPPLTACVIFACVAIFIGLKTLGNDPLYAETARFGLYPTVAVWEGKPWALITSAFVHIEIWHIFFNLYWLWLLGGNLERDIGSLRWIIFVLAAAWVSSAAQLASGDTGIGFSGVGYALFGFAWVAREKLSHTRPIANDSTVNLFLIWFVAGIVLTKFNVLSIGNEAHFGGLVFGCAVGWFYARRNRAWLGALATLLLVGASFVPLFYNPMSSDWTALQAQKALEADKFPQAIHWLKRALKQGTDEKWAWQNLAYSYTQIGDFKAATQAQKEYEKVAVQENKSPENSSSDEENQNN
jgi:GlpG protein